MNDEGREKVDSKGLNLQAWTILSELREEERQEIEMLGIVAL